MDDMNNAGRMDDGRAARNALGADGARGADAADGAGAASGAAESAGATGASGADAAGSPRVVIGAGGGASAASGSSDADGARNGAFPGAAAPAASAPSTFPTPPQGYRPQGSQQVHWAAGAPPAASERRPGGARTFLLAFAGAALACALGVGGFAAWQAVASADGQTQLGGSSTTIKVDGGDVSLAEAVAQKALPSVAAIDVYTDQSSGYGPYGFGSSDSGVLTQSSLGSGVVLTSDGYIITNYHVVEDADALKVTIEGEQYDAEVVGSDPSSDIAVVKAKDAAGLEPIELGDSDDLTIGEWVMTIGSPFGLEQSVATGIISATSRSQIMDSSSSGEATIYPNMIQTDAAINPGNSGGALVDAEGKLIGINTMITSYSGNYSGVGFAIPVNYAVSLAQQIIDGETPTHAQLGVSLTTVNAQIAQRYGFAVDAGAYVSRVERGSGADEAGIKVGDIITKFDDQAVSSASDLMLDVRSKNPGDTATLEVNRGGETKVIEVTLGSDEEAQAAANQQSSAYDSLLDRLLGGGSDDSRNAA